MDLSVESRLEGDTTTVMTSMGVAFERGTFCCGDTHTFFSLISFLLLHIKVEHGRHEARSARLWKYLEFLMEGAFGFCFLSP